MKTEIRPKIESGFFLNETELMRIKDAQNEQIKKISGGVDADFEFEVKYKNGAISVPDSISDVLSEENDGTESVVRLTITAKSSLDENNKIGISFNDVSQEINSDASPISYIVQADDKDWTFVTSSTIEERIGKVKTGKIPNGLMNNRLNSVTPLIFMVGAFAISFLSFSNPEEGRVQKLQHIRDTSSSVIDYIHRVNLLQAQEMNRIAYAPLGIVAFFIIIVFLMMIRRPIAKWYPHYTFYWGDNIKRYDRKIATIRFVSIGIVFTIIIGIAVNYLSDRLF